jgi:hypothetical protein
VVRDDDVVDALVGPSASVLHRLSFASDDQRHTALAGDPPLPVDLFDVLYVDSVSALGLSATSEHRGSHLTRRRADISREQSLVLEIKIDSIDESLAVEEPADGDFHALDFPLELEARHPVAPRFLVGTKDVHHVAAVVLVADVEESLDLLDLPERFDHVRCRVLLDVPDTDVEILEDVVVDSGDRVALAVYLPGEITDQSRVHRDEEESTPVHTPPIHGVDKVSPD